MRSIRSASLDVGVVGERRLGPRGRRAGSGGRRRTQTTRASNRYRSSVHLCRQFEARRRRRWLEVVEERPPVVAHHQIEQRALDARCRRAGVAAHSSMHPLVAGRRRLDDLVAGVGEQVGRPRAPRRRSRGRSSPPGGSASTAMRSRSPGARSVSTTGSASGSRSAGRPGRRGRPDVGHLARHRPFDEHQLDASELVLRRDRRSPSARRRSVGLIDAMPQQCAGLRSEPPMSLPRPSGLMPDAIADASPPLEPPAVRPGSTGCG